MPDSHLPTAEYRPEDRAGEGTRELSALPDDMASRHEKFDLFIRTFSNIVKKYRISAGQLLLLRDLIDTTTRHRVKAGDNPPAQMPSYDVKIESEKKLQELARLILLEVDPNDLNEGVNLNELLQLKKAIDEQFHTAHEMKK